MGENACTFQRWRKNSKTTFMVLVVLSQRGPSTLAYRSAASPTWLLAQYFNWPFLREGNAAISRVVAKTCRKSQSWKVEARGGGEA